MISENTNIKRIKTNVAPVFLHPRPLSLIRNALHTIHKRVYLQMTKCIHQSVELGAQMEMVRCRDARKIPSTPHGGILRLLSW